MSNFISKIEDNEFGEIHFYRNMRAKRMNIRVYSDYLRVLLPPRLSEKDGLKFVNEIRENLRTSRSKLPEISPLHIDDEKPLQTYTFLVKTKKSERDNIYSKLDNDILTIEYPHTFDTNTAATQTYFWNSINYFLRNEAKRILYPLTLEMAKKHNFTITDIKIQSSKTRWGSCSSKKSINLSQYLLLVPYHLIEYVVLHELCHTVEMNHSPRFWALMDKVTNGKAQAYRKELKNYYMPKY